MKKTKSINQLQLNLHVRPPLQNTKNFSIKALNMEPFVNEHLS